MWILTLTPHDNTGSGCGIALSDKSVSRLHAELEVVHAKENLALPERQPQVSITDKSRFGTLHNGTKLAAGEPTRLAAGDELKFGVNQDAYRLAFVPLVAYWGARNAGVLSREEQALILKSLHKLGGHVAYGPEDATVSVMKEVSVSPAASVQLLHSLVRGLPIITPAYLQAIVDRPALSTPLPSATDYAPQVRGKDRKEVSAVEARLKAVASGGGQSSMADEPARLFDGKSFVIMSSRQTQLGEVISALGGLVVESLGRESDQFYHQHRRACIVLPPEKAEGETTAEDKEARLKVDQFRKAGVRPIPSAEVASAIILGDVSTHCNPPPPAEAPPLAKGTAAAEKKRKATPEPAAAAMAAPVAIVLDETDENEDEDEPSLVITKIVDAEEVKKEKTETEGKQAGKRKHLEEKEEEKKEEKGARRATAVEAAVEAEQPQPKKRRVMEIPAAGAVAAPKKRKAAEPDGDEGETEGDNTKKKAREEEEPEAVSTMKETTKPMTTTLVVAVAAGEGDLGHEEAEGEPQQPKRETPPVVERLMVTANKRLLARPLQAAPNFKRFSKNAASGEAARVQASQAKRPHVIACVEDDGKPSEEMESWLRESTEGEKGKTKLDSAADELWEAKPRSFPARSGSSSSSAAATASTTSKLSAGKTTFSLTRHTRSASTSAAAAPASTATTKKPASRRKTTFV
ncbi:FHA domain containing protein [Acanthamoeba castellanii str. Neff]|uniref:FHA domain containing protein n=1 Tax=Acanthamoeba castellanii (strain ATCC 30010 / Neff) TaxID=1257118 RepID=L8HKP4_ACACF|nr:FHA domain containing protein [Acanthamoeba castellanii str. Neff]ELR25243.1 FHA domain containing protein [Acanthamoeba castellanii str. Neff]